jgi:hypothetical protein
MASGDLSAPAVFPKKQLISHCDCFGKVSAFPNFRNYFVSTIHLIAARHRDYPSHVSRVFHRLVIMKVAVFFVPFRILRPKSEVSC